MKQRIFTIFLGNEDDEKEINMYLNEGWLVKELQTVSENDASYAVVLIEKKELF